MDDKEMQDYLNALDNEHEPESVEDGFGSLPDAKYVGRLDKIYISTAKSSGRLQCVMEFDVVSGKYASRKIFKFAGMDKAESLDYLTRDLRKLGIDNFKWSNVQSRFKEILDSFYMLQLKTKGDFQSVYILQEVDPNKMMVDQQFTGAPKNIDDDVPF